MKDYEDEAFEDIERKSRPSPAKTDLNPYETIVRNRTLEEVAQKIEGDFSRSFGRDTVASFACYIRGMKQ